MNWSTNIGGNEMAEIKYEITQELGVLSESKSGWTRELNLISWNGAAPKYDIRDWSPEHHTVARKIQQAIHWSKQWSENTKSSPFAVVPVSKMLFWRRRSA